MKNKCNLTPKQELLVRGVAEGLTHYEAYAKAFSIKGKTKHSIESTVSEILKKPECLAYREKLEGEARARTVVKVQAKIMSEEERKERLTAMIEQAQDAGEFVTAARLIAELNKMTNAYTPQQMEVKQVIDMESIINAVNSKT